MTDSALRVDIAAIASRMARVGSCWGPHPLPGEKRCAFISNLSGAPQVWTMPLSGGFPRQVTSGPDPVGDIRPSPNGAWIAFQWAPGGGMNSQISIVRQDGTELRLLTDGGRDNNWLGEWLPDSRYLTMMSTRDDPAAMNLYVVDVESGEGKVLARNRGSARVAAVDRTGNRVLYTRVVSRSDANLYLADLHSGEETLLTPHRGPATVGDARFSPDGRTVYLATNLERDRIGLASIALADGVGPVTYLLERDDADVQEFVIAPSGLDLAVLWNTDGRNELHFDVLSAGEEEARPGPDLPAEIAMGLEYAPDGTLVAAITGSTQPLNIWSLPAGGDTWIRLTDSPHPGVDLSSLVKPELVRYQAHDGLGLSAWLYVPQAYGRPGPLVINFHGGPEAQERPRFNATFAALLAAGIAVLSPNVRGSAGFGKRFVNLDNGPLRVDAVRDIRACVDFVVQEGIAAPGRIGIMGGSYGGYMTMAGLVEYPDLFAAGANLFGVVNFETFFRDTEPWMAAISTVEYGDPVTQADLLRDLSPIHRIQRVTAPTLVLHGANDTNVPVVEAEQVVESLRARSIPVEYVLFPDEGHGFVKEPNRIRSVEAVVRWFLHHL